VVILSPDLITTGTGDIAPISASTRLRSRTDSVRISRFALTNKPRVVAKTNARAAYKAKV